MIKIEGLDELNKKFDDLVESAETINGTQQVPLSELLTPSFLAKHTRFLSEDEMFEASGYKVESSEDLEKIPDEDWNEFIGKNTPFATWGEMLSAAGTKWGKKKLGFDTDEL